MSTSVLVFFKHFHEFYWFLIRNKFNISSFENLPQTKETELNETKKYWWFISSTTCTYNNSKLVFSYSLTPKIYPFFFSSFSLCAWWLLFNLCFVQEVFDILNVFKSLHKCSQLRRHVDRMIREIFRYDIQYIIYLNICNGYLSQKKIIYEK